MELSFFLLGISIGFAVAVIYVVITRPSFADIEVDKASLKNTASNSKNDTLSIAIPITKIVAIAKVQHKK